MLIIIFKNMSPIRHAKAAVTDRRQNWQMIASLTLHN